MRKKNYTYVNIEDSGECQIIKGNKLYKLDSFVDLRKVLDDKHEEIIALDEYTSKILIIAIIRHQMIIKE